MAALQPDAAAVAAVPVAAAIVAAPLPVIGGVDAQLRAIADAVNAHTAGIANLVAQGEANAAANANLVAQVANLANNVDALVLTIQHNHDVAMAPAGAAVRPFTFEFFCSMVKRANRALVGPHAVVMPLPVPAPAGANAQVYPMRPAAWPDAGYTKDALMRLQVASCNQLIEAYHLVLPPGSTASVKRNSILAHLGLDPILL
jgi:hypothetical protein